VSQAPGKLERRARALLRAYPAEYRHGRAEEIIGTLLEAAPPGRSLPSAREAWSLIAGGRHARAARNRRPGVKANVRLALLLGISIYLSFYFVPFAGSALGFVPGSGASWLTDTTLAAGAAVALAPWLGSRAATAALAFSAGALVAYGDLSGSHGGAAVMSDAELLIVMTALAALSGGPVRLPRSWLWLPGAFPLALVAGRLLSPRHAPGPALEWSLLGALVLLAVVVVCWLVTDARPAFALCLAVLLQAVTTTLPELAYGDYFLIDHLEFFLVVFAIVLPILLPAAWLLLRREKTPSPRPYPEQLAAARHPIGTGRRPGHRSHPVEEAEQQAGELRWPLF
jgi:hypothetical protein